MNASAKSRHHAETIVGDPRWRSIMRREAAADGSFVYSVATTGIYCRPSCGARRARPENVRFHPSADDAERAGFRPCKRCKPREKSLHEAHSALVARVCRLIERSDTPMTLSALAKQSGLSAYHLHRVFKATTGLTPRAYAAAQRGHRIRTTLPRARSVTEAIYDAGYSSSGRFYAHSRETLGMTPATYRTGGDGMRIRFATGACSFGAVLVAATDRGVCAVLLGDDAPALERDLHARFPRAQFAPAARDFTQTLQAVIALIEQPKIGIHLPLDIRGSAFQQRVWQALRQIPAGKTLSYSELARHIGAPRSVRAVASACAANPLAVAIPCHRVLRSDGSISGYRWGVKRKQALLEREAED